MRPGIRAARVSDEREADMSKETGATSAELIKRSEELRQQGEALKKKEAPEVMAKIKEAIAHYGFTAADLGLAGVKAKTRAPQAKKAKPAKSPTVASTVKVKAPSVAKYRDDAGHSWTGIGPKPKWLREALAAGATEASLKA